MKSKFHDKFYSFSKIFISKNLNKIFSDFKTILSIGDLVVNKLVDVKYGGTQKQQMYRAKIVQINADDQTILVHYLGWNNR